MISRQVLEKSISCNRKGADGGWSSSSCQSMVFCVCVCVCVYWFVCVCVALQRPFCRAGKPHRVITRAALLMPLRWHFCRRGDKSRVLSWMAMCAGQAQHEAGVCDCGEPADGGALVRQQLAPALDRRDGHHCHPAAHCVLRLWHPWKGKCDTRLRRFTTSTMFLFSFSALVVLL